jgi:hypothetical protein
MSEANTAGWQAYANSEASRLKTDVAMDRGFEGTGYKPSNFVDEWVRLTAPQQASVIRELGVEAKGGDKQAAETLRQALSNYETPSAKALNDELKQLGFKDVTITDENVANLAKNYKGITINGPNGQYFHENGAGEITAINDPAYGNGRYYADSQTAADYAMSHGLATEWIPTAENIDAASRALTAGQLKRENW